MKKILLIGLAGVVLIAGFIFVSAGPSDESDSVANSNDSSAQAVIAGGANQELVSSHLKTAVKKQSLDATNKKQLDITIGDFFYDPTVVKVTKGTTVTWKNTGMISHDVKIDSNSPSQGPSSDLLGRQESYSYTFDEAGLYLYYCSPHPTQMRAVIEVVE